MQITPPSTIAAAPRATPAIADQLERAFLEEMLKYCGPRAVDGAFSGGAGESQFASFLTREHAAIMAGKMDLGFAGMLGEAVR
ncbi:hypothetical protein [Paracoccus spongiarum]|uniref:Flagellar biosynthesis protein FlgJ n=1 Tax=Paracoccus spongiarum TaxID=3064387 RepID=A0ABT9JGL4_9RHOB|nr:hypothetical protein [Paracoccus sp. 2205BS29-5]MDP5308775.1 hypothetical protein [Paracoccus sp. 2205BS29-5]